MQDAIQRERELYGGDVCGDDDRRADSAVKISLRLTMLVVLMFLWIWRETTCAVERTIISTILWLLMRLIENPHLHQKWSQRFLSNEFFEGGYDSKYNGTANNVADIWGNGKADGRNGSAFDGKANGVADGSIDGALNSAAKDLNDVEVSVALTLGLMLRLIIGQRCCWLEGRCLWKRFAW